MSLTCQNAQRLKGGSCQFAGVDRRIGRAGLCISVGEHSPMRRRGDARGRVPLRRAVPSRRVSVDERLPAAVTATQVTLANWQQPGQSALGVPAHAGDHPDPTDPGRRRGAPADGARTATWATSRCRGSTAPSTVDAGLGRHVTDAVLVLHDGVVVDERYFAGMTAVDAATC